MFKFDLEQIDEMLTEDEIYMLSWMYMDKHKVKEYYKLSDKGAERLKKMISLLMKIPDENFVITQWVNKKLRDGNTIQKILEDVRDRSCGTAACAGGWACTDPDFIEQGLMLRKAWGDRVAPVYNGYKGLQAMAAFFEIPSMVADELFDSDWYEDKYRLEEPEEVTPAMVAEQLQKFLEEFYDGKDTSS
jgi:hypothetical protein